MALTVDYKTFNVTFVENKRYNPITRTLKVKALDELHARSLVSSQFDTYKFDKKMLMELPTGKRISITDVKEIKE